jgi:formylglycine-generating enzyme required for sulfatase activity
MAVDDDLRALAARHGLGDAVLAQLLAVATVGTADTLAPGSTVDFDGGATPAPAVPAGVQKYDELGLLGVGGMGEVHKVRDRDLDRVVALKTIRRELAGNAGAVARFEREARATAGLQHPGVVPVHELGIRDGRPFFTMREIRGRTLTQVIQEVHGGAEGSWSFRRVIDALRTVCETVAYAHAQGIVHRDLKPDNVMVGDFAEVLVVDWGLAESAAAAGRVAGTPAYMAPEQARGERIDAQADVYSLGAVLYEIISGRPPFEAGGSEILAAVRAGARPGPPAGPIAPPELVELCVRAMSASRADRPAGARAFGDAIGGWLDGARRREQALAVVERAEKLAPEVEDLRVRAAGLRAKAAAALDGVQSWDAEDKKTEGWTLEDEARRLERDAELRELEVTQQLYGALAHADDLPEARSALASRYMDAHRSAEAARNPALADRAEVLLRVHLGSLAPGDPVRAAAERYLAGDGALTLATDPPASAELYRFEEQHRRLVPVRVGSLGVTPLAGVAIPMGSYLVALRAEGRSEVHYPVKIGRTEHWDAGAPIPLPAADSLGPNDVYVPAGWFVSGGDHGAVEPLPRRRLWCHGFVVRRFPVTVAEYLGFLDAIDDPSGLVPATRAGEPLASRVDGRFTLPDGWAADWPILHVDWASARAYAASEAARTGLPWRLPVELEWEKAARGVDERIFPWGDFLDASWCRILSGQSGEPSPGPVGGSPVDASPYGVRDCAGNAREWCADAYVREGIPQPGDRVRLDVEGDGASSSIGTVRRVRRGGSWDGSPQRARVVTRGKGDPSVRNEHLTFRLVRSWP